MNLESEYRKIKDDYKEKEQNNKAAAARERGFAFEKLIHKILENAGILLSSSYKTADTSQQIDGAVRIFSRIFLIEAKWERTETLAASKLFSFLGKINSKIDGTLGLFISYHELKDNFLSSVRSGIRQNCIIIHGKEAIEDIICGRVEVDKYLEYVFEQVSIHGKIFVDTPEFLSRPVKNTKQVDGWNSIVTSLLDSNTSSTEFLSTIEISYSENINLSKKTLNLFTGLTWNNQIKIKYDKLIFKCIIEENDTFSKELVGKLKSSKWERYAESDFLENLVDKLNFEVKSISDQDKDDILAIAIDHLKENEGSFEEENKASRLIMFLFDKLSNDDFKDLAKAYLSIYCDDFRKWHYDQKKAAKKIFDHIGLKKAVKIVWPEIIEKLKVAKEDYYIFDDKENSSKNKDRSIRRVCNTYKILFDRVDSIQDKLEKAYDKI